MTQDKAKISGTVMGSKPVIAASVVRDRHIPPGIIGNPADPDLRQDIGARNPYALAEVIYARTEHCPLAWVADEPEYNRDLLEDILDCKYAKLFDPIFKVSPLFSRAVYAKIGVMPAVVSLMNKKFIPHVIERVGGGRIIFPQKGPGNPQRLMQATVMPGSKDIPKSESGGGSSGPADVHAEASPCSDTGDHWGIYKIPGTSNRGYYCKKSTGNKSEIIDDAVQGCSRSCYLIAALASLAWCKYPASFPANIDMTNKGVLKDTYTFDFWDTGGVKKPQTVGLDLVLNLAGTEPVFARPSASYEVWHALYEKAYGCFKQLTESTLPRDENCPAGYPHPHIPGFSGGNPVTALFNLTNAAYTTGETYFLTKDIFGQAFTKINTQVTWKDASNGSANRPITAWSYISSAAANAVQDVADITYKSEIIVANHSYSILGALKNGGNNYIVLRNPYGRLWGADPTDPEISGYLYTGTWSPVTNYSKTLSTDDGIFALRADRFELYFEGFGWVNA